MYHMTHGGPVQWNLWRQDHEVTLSLCGTGYKLRTTGSIVTTLIVALCVISAVELRVKKSSKSQSKYCRLKSSGILNACLTAKLSSSTVSGIPDGRVSFSIM